MKRYSCAEEAAEAEAKTMAPFKKKAEDLEKKVAELSFKQSELKPVIDELTRRFEEAYKNDTVNVGWKPGEAKEDVINAIKNKVTPYL